MYDGDLAHHGIKGQKWGVRRFQTKDGGLTPAGKKRYSSDKLVTVRQANKNAKAAGDDAAKKAFTESAAVNKGFGSYRKASNAASKARKEAEKESFANDRAHNKAVREARAAEKGSNGLTDKQKENLKIGAAVAGTALAAYGVYKVSSAIKDKNFSRTMDRGMKCAEHWMEEGRWEVGMEQIKAAYSVSYNQSVGDIVKRTVANNSVNGKVDWKRVRKALI